MKYKHGVFTFEKEGKFEFFDVDTDKWTKDGSQQKMWFLPPHEENNAEYFMTILEIVTDAYALKNLEISSLRLVYKKLGIEEMKHELLEAAEFMDYRIKTDEYGFWKRM